MIVEKRVSYNWKEGKDACIDKANESYQNAMEEYSLSQSLAVSLQTVPSYQTVPSHPSEDPIVLNYTSANEPKFALVCFEFFFEF